MLIGCYSHLSTCPVSICLCDIAFIVHFTIFILITAHAPLSAHVSYFEVINHKIIYHLPIPIHKAYIPSWILLGISLKPVKIIIFGSILVTNSETHKHPPGMIYLSALSALILEWIRYMLQERQCLREVAAIMNFQRSYEILSFRLFDTPTPLTNSVRCNKHYYEEVDCKSLLSKSGS